MNDKHSILKDMNVDNPELPPKTDEYLTLDEVAQKLKISRVTVYRMVHRKEIPAIKLGKAWRVSSNKIAELFET